jgi:hypothetical protein
MALLKFRPILKSFRGSEAKGRARLAQQRQFDSFTSFLSSIAGKVNKIINI